MDTRPELNYQELLLYIRKQPDEKPAAGIIQLRREEPVFSLLFDLIDEALPALSAIPLAKLTPDKPALLPLGNLLAGSADNSERHSFLQALCSSESYYQHLLLQLLELDHQRQQKLVDHLGIELVQVRSNAELLRDAGGIASTAKAVDGQRGRQPVPMPGFLERFRWSIAAAVPALLLLLLTINGLTQGPLGKFALNSALPDGYAAQQTSSTRGSSAPGQINLNGLPQQIQSLNALLSVSSLAYGNGEYDKAISKLLEGAAIAQALQNTSIGALQDSLRASEWSDSNLTSLLASAQQVARDYHFYLGIYYLARIGKGDAPRAVASLKTALQLTEKYQLEMTHREHYYLGLALAYAGGKDTALTVLHAIPQNSSYYQRSAIAIERLGLSFYERMLDF